MSRIGNKPIQIPSGVEIKIDKELVSVKGPKGHLDQKISSQSLSLDLSDDILSISRKNDDLIRAVKENTPDILILYRPQFISSRTIKRIKSINSKLVVCCYNNDDPFSTSYPWYYWRVFQKSICEYDFEFAYREKKISEN